MMDFTPRLLPDTTVLLQDFFFRLPEHAPQKGSASQQEALNRYRQQVHEGLLFLSDQAVELVLPSFVLSRYIAVLCELFVPTPVVQAELDHWLQQAEGVDLGMQDLATLNQLSKQEAYASLSPDFLLLWLAAQKSQASHILSCQPYTLPAFEGVFIVKPEQVLSLFSPDLS